MTVTVDADPPPGGAWDNDDRDAIAKAEAAGFKATNPNAADPQARLFYSRLVVGDYLDVMFAAHRGGFVHRFAPYTPNTRPAVVEHAAGPVPHIVAAALRWWTA